MYRIRKSFTFEAAHQLETAFTAGCHECIHGHSYTVEMYIDAEILQQDQRMVIDFGELKPFKDMIMEMWDHGLLLHVNKKPHIQPLIDAGVLRASKVSFLELQPTAEVLARMIYGKLHDWLGTHLQMDRLKRGVFVSGIRVHETGTGWAEYFPGK